MQVAAKFLARSGCAGLAVAYHAGAGRHPSCICQRTYRKNHAGGIAAGIGHQPRRRDFFAVKFWQTVYRFAQPRGVRRGKLVPPLESCCVVKTKSSAQIHYAKSRFKKLRRNFAGRFVRRGQQCRARAAVHDRFHRQSTDRSLPFAAQLRKKLRQAVRPLRLAHIKR